MIVVTYLHALLYSEVYIKILERSRMLKAHRNFQEIVQYIFVIFMVLLRKMIENLVFLCLENRRSS